MSLGDDSRPGPVKAPPPASSRFDDEGRASWGYGPFLHRRGAEVGDVLTIRFDLAAEHVILTLGEEITPDESD